MQHKKLYMKCIHISRCETLIRSSNCSRCIIINWCSDYILYMQKSSCLYSHLPSNSMSSGFTIGSMSFSGMYTSLPSLPIPRLVVEDCVMDP